jgi:excisionase family DNA binding protein
MQTIDAKQAAEFLNLCYDTVIILAKKGEIPCKKVGGRWRFLDSALADWISGNYNEPKTPTERLDLKIITGGKQCQSTSAANIGGSILNPQTASIYNDLLKPKTSNKRKNSMTD